MSWLYLFLAGIFEVAFASLMPASRGFTSFLPSSGVVLAGICSLLLLSKAVERIPISMAYPIWVGIGVAGAVGLELFLKREALNLGAVISVVLILCGVVGVKLSSSTVT